jgi:DNA repair protein RecN (Recombination protein N)
LVARLEAAEYELSDVASELARLVPDPDPAALESVRDRLGLLARLRRKFGDTEGDVLAYLEKASARARALENDTQDITTLEAEVADIENTARERASELSKARASAAPKLATEAEGLLGELAMPGVAFEVTLVPADLYEGGLENVQFLIATGSGEKPKPVSKIASGGELSRIGLTLHLLTSGSAAPTLIFDEIDAGVGGAAARAVGAALARLSRSGDAQVLVVTHLPQVAAFADRQFRVTRVEGERRGVVVEAVEGDDRIEELSRMLAGLPESERAREHAQELLEMAGAGKGA